MQKHENMGADNWKYSYAGTQESIYANQRSVYSGLSNVQVKLSISGNALVEVLSFTVHCKAQDGPWDLECEGRLMTLPPMSLKMPTSNSWAVEVEFEYIKNNSELSI